MREHWRCAVSAAVNGGARGDQLHYRLGTRYHSIAHLLGFSVAIALFALCCWGVFRMAPWLVRLLGQTGINVITRIMGLLLMALGIEFIVTGIKGIFPGLLN